jgi:hypothetical protein
MRFQVSGFRGEGPQKRNTEGAEKCREDTEKTKNGKACTAEDAETAGSKEARKGAQWAAARREVPLCGPRPRFAWESKGAWDFARDDNVNRREVLVTRCGDCIQSRGNSGRHNG